MTFLKLLFLAGAFLFSISFMKIKIKNVSPLQGSILQGFIPRVETRGYKYIVINDVESQSR